MFSNIAFIRVPVSVRSGQTFVTLRPEGLTTNIIMQYAILRMLQRQDIFELAVFDRFRGSSDRSRTMGWNEKGEQLSSPHGRLLQNRPAVARRRRCEGVEIGRDQSRGHSAVPNYLDRGA